MRNDERFEPPMDVDDLIALLKGLRGRTAVYEDVRAGRIKSVRLGKRYLIPQSEVRRLTGQD